MLLGYHEFFLLYEDSSREPETSAVGAVTEVAAESLTSAERARVVAFFAALTGGGVWSYGSLIAFGYWLITGRGPGGRRLASGSGSGAAGSRGLLALVAKQRTAHPSN